jgi:hypothetical protein
MVALPRVPRKYPNLIRALKDQRELLRNAAERYDAGSEVEAKNIAVRLRVLLHDTRRSHSLLAQLDVKERLPYVDTSKVEMPDVISLGAGLCMVRAELGENGYSRYVPTLEIADPERTHPPQAFVDWWSESIVTSNSGEPVCRRDFVLWLANEDGGAHVDPSLHGEYADLSTAGLTTFRPDLGEDPKFKDLVAPSVRQIAFELEKTLDTNLCEEKGGLKIRGPICSLPITTKIDAGRNEPCPCGSGLKTKRCFATREPRRRMTMAELLDRAA